VENLNLLGRIARLLKDPSFKKKLMGAKTQKEIFQVISDEDERY
jgi:mannitol/fructose-specific phosphotransferase system IIA component (Ntr-type)